MKTHSFSSTLAACVLSASVIALSLVVAQRAAATIDPPQQTVCFANAGQTSCVDRPTLSSASTITDEVRSLTQWLIAGPTANDRAAGIQSALPSGAQLGQIQVADQQATIGLILPDDFLRTLTANQVEDINEEFRVTLTAYNFQRLEIDARGSTGGYHLLSDFLPPIEQPHKPYESTSSPALAGDPLKGAGGWGGGLTNKTVFVSAGHGWAWNTTLNSFKTQRPAYPSAPYPTGEGIIEDFNNAEAVNQYLLPYLQNAGADAWTVRERDMNTQLLIIDDLNVGFTTAGNWTSNTGGYYGAYHSTTTVNASPTATATWTFTPPLTDTYAVYARFPSAAITRTVDARFFVDHAGAVTPIIIPQARDGDNWRYLGRYPFYGGRPARIWLTNQSATPGVTVLADAIRIGGGVGDTSVAGAPISNKPRWEEQASQYAKWIGMPNVEAYSDVRIRPLYAEWEKEASEDAVYISWHTNGFNGYNTTARGTESSVFLTPTLGSTALQSFVQTELVNAIHTQWDAGWPDRGQSYDDLGELRMLSTMPGILIENGFHDNPIDVEAMKDPRFMQLSARAIYHGLVNYWHAIDPNVPLTYLPEPPQQVIVRNSGPGRITLSWKPGPIDGSGPLGDAATTYRVYTSPDGFGWSNPIDVATTAYTLTQLAPNQLIFIKVTGVNAGGESLASPVLAARAALSGQAPALIVYGFDRIDRSGDTQQNDPPEGYSRRVFIDRINRFDAIIQHAEVITLPFDSAQRAVVSQGSIGLSSYPIVDWIAGENQAPFTTLTTHDQTALTNFLNGGGALFITGSKIGYELQGTPFYANTLRASFVADAAQTYSTNPTAGGIFNGLGTINFDDGSHGLYDVDAADVIAPINGAASSLVYNTASAAVQYANGCMRLVYSAVPFETIYPRALRQAMMTRLIKFLGVCLPVSIVSPLNGSFVKTVPAFSGTVSGSATQVQVSIRRVSDTTFYNGSTFVIAPETWLTATAVNPWSYALPALNDGAYVLRARVVSSGPIVDPSPAAVTFTLDTVAPATPQIITPTNGISFIAVAPLFVWMSDAIPGGRWDVDVDGTLHTVFVVVPPPGTAWPTGTVTLSFTWPVTDGLHQWRVRASDTAGNLSGWSETGTFSTTSLKVFLPWVLKNYPVAEWQPTCYNAIVNGGFESGDFTGWTQPSQNPPGVIVTDAVFSGNFAARIGAATISDPMTTTSYSSIMQNLTIPANAITATLSFARYRWSGDTSGDKQYAAVLRTGQPVDYLFSEGAADPGWNTVSFDLKSYAGQTIDLLFSVMNNGQDGSTGLALDDVQTQVCVP